MYQKEGLDDIPSVTTATDEYAANEDTIGQFLIDEISTTVNELTAGETYNKYKAWAEDNGEFCLSNKIFKQAMEERGWVSVRKEKGNIYKRVDEMKNDRDLKDSKSIHQKSFEEFTDNERPF